MSSGSGLVAPPAPAAAAAAAAAPVLGAAAPSSPLFPEPMTFVGFKQRKSFFPQSKSSFFHKQDTSKPFEAKKQSFESPILEKSNNFNDMHKDNDPKPKHKKYIDKAVEDVMDMIKNQASA
jgi:hypothetical protein